MKIVLIGCSHGKHLNLTLPTGDILVHSGDFSRRGDESDAISFLKWFEKQPFKERVFVCGNHERYAEAYPDAFASLVAQHAPSCHYLHDRSLILGGLKWHGSNYTPFFNNWHFMSARGAAMQAHWDKIDSDVDVLLTHGPAMGRLDLIEPEYGADRDLHQGCGNLRTTIDGRLKRLKYHFFSHLHYQGCQQETVDGVTYVNAAVVDDDYRLRPMSSIQVVEINP